jgi:hypothetical protein
MADNALTGTNVPVATDKVTYSGDADQNVQLVRPVLTTGAEGSKTVVELPGDATNGLDVDVTRLPALAAGTNNIGDVDVLTLPSIPAGTNNIGDVDVLTLPAIPAGTNNIGDVDVLTLPGVGGDVAHDGADSGNPVKIGAKAIAYAAQTPVAAGDRSDLFCDRHGSLFVVGGHPDVVTQRTTFTAAQTNVALVTVSAGTKIVVTQVQVTVDNASTVFPLVRIGFATATTPTTTGVVASHPGVASGGGFTRGDGSGILGVGADDEDLRITTVGLVGGNGCDVVVTYYTIPS